MSVKVNLEDFEWNYRQQVPVRKGDKTDGAPDNYFQVYADDVEPPDGFKFPLPSPWVTKSILPPDPQRISLVNAVNRFLMVLACAWWFGSLFHPYFFLFAFWGWFNLSTFVFSSLKLSYEVDTYKELFTILLKGVSNVPQ